MSDFTDDEDRQLVQLALVFSHSRRQILWDTLTQQMKGSKKPKEALRQRLKTLKRTHGRDLETFPAWFFRTKFATEINRRRRAHVYRKSAMRKKNKLAPTRGSQYIPQGRARRESEAALHPNGLLSIQTPREFAESSPLEMSALFSECATVESPASLLLLASVAAFEH
uniref:MADF domain-containing protein n=1 Tax=Peronospora matthiolae TaxID=2874970 RepID=A0AAV1T3T0_9STRA